MKKRRKKERERKETELNWIREMTEKKKKIREKP